jgi:hypothetical protein
VIQPYRCWTEVQARDLVLRQICSGPNLGDVCFTGGQKRQCVPRRLQQCACQNADEFRRRIIRDIEILASQGFLTLLGTVVPRCLAARDAEGLRDRGLHVVVAASGVFDRHSCGIELPGRDDVVAASAVVERIPGAHRIGAHALDGLEIPPPIPE